MKIPPLIMYIFSSVRRLHQLRCVQYFVKLFVLIHVIVILRYAYSFTVEQLYFYSNYVAFVQQFASHNRSAECVIPKLDPWDERVKPYYFKVPPLSCTKIQPYLTEVTINGKLQWNLTEYNSITVGKLHCHYQEFIRDAQNDSQITKLPKRAFRRSVQLKAAFVIVKCKRNGKRYYHNMHWWIPPKTFAHLKISDNSRPNVQILMIDAVAQSNFIRQLPSTYKVLTEEMSSIIIKGLIKVGINTFPNLGALLTGTNVTKNDKPNDTEYDEWPFVWKNFSQAGYVTSFAEDMPNFTAFNYMAKGFKYQPTDFYMRPFWLAMTDKNITMRSSRNCFGNIPEHQLILDFAKQSLERYKNYSFFTFTSVGKISHDYLNLIQVLDDELAQFCRWFYEHHSNNTIFILMSDHGINFGNFRWQTQLGRVESTLPFFSIYLPKNLRKLYPNLELNLRNNQYRMSSWYDVYDMLMDIVTLRFDSPRMQWSKNGISLFHPHPIMRTCNEAGIPPEHCPCEEEIQLSPNSTVDLTTVANDIVTHVNNLLINSPECTPLTLSHINNAVKIIPNPSTAKAKGFQNVLRLIISVKPGSALLEATMQSDAWSKNYKPVGTIIRVNKFANTSCIYDNLLKHYCCCNC